MASPKTPAVAIIIPAHNGACVIEETLISVRDQTCQDFEVIIVDDASTDETVPIVRRFCGAHPRFRLLTQAHGGVSAARNQAILHARAEWIAMLDQDDIWFPQKLERQLALAGKAPGANFFFTNFYFWDGERDLRLMYPPDGIFPEGDTLPRLIFDYTYCLSTVMVKKQLLLDIELFDPGLAASQDWDLWLRIAERGIRARGIREPLVRYRRWPGSVTIAKADMSIEDNALMIEKRMRLGRRPELLPLYRRSLAGIRTSQEMVRARPLIETDPAAVPDFVWRAWRHDRRWKWLRWYLCLKWPKILGGNAARRNVHRKILARW